MALRTGLAADEGCDGSAQRAPRLPAAMHEEECETDREHDERGDRCPDPDCAPRQKAAVVYARSGILRWLGPRCTAGAFATFRGRLGSVARHNPLGRYPLVRHGAEPRITVICIAWRSRHVSR